MMNWANDIVILAQDEGESGAWRFIFIAILVIMWIVSSVLKKASERKTQEQAQRRKNELPRQLSETQQEEQDEPDWEVVAPDESFEPASPPLRPEPAPIQLQTIEEVSPPRLPSGQVQKRSLRDLVKKRGRTRIPDEGLLSSLEVDVGTLEPTGIPAAFLSARAAGTRLHLTNPETAREAIIFHEIFSPPRALRDTPEMWD